MNRLFIVTAFVSAWIVVSGCNRGKAFGAAQETASSDSKTRPNFAFITNGVADFWEHARAGANAAGKEFGVEVSVITPSSITDQTRKIEDLLTRGTNGI